MSSDFKKIVDNQKKFFATNATLPLSFRVKQLKKLKTIIQDNEAAIALALKKDLNKPLTEAVLDEILLVMAEIDFIIKNLKKWASPKKVPTPFPALWPGNSVIHREPYGTTLIIGPWNYPCLLILSPLAGAIAAGNCVVIKPSEVAAHTQDIILKLINENFPPEFITAVQADGERTSELLEEPFNYIFYTGNPQIGKIVMQAAAKQLTPVTLELGGKSPCIVDATANITFAARRIIWAKTTNAGQVCLAPDYLYVHESCKQSLIENMQQTLVQFFGPHPKLSDSYGRIINKKHYLRLTKLMQHGKIIWGGDTDETDCYISPTLIEDVSWDDPIMQEEIFGPLLPIFSYQHINDVMEKIRSRPKPLALYLFTHDEKIKNNVLTLSFGGGAINDCLMHVANVNLPFGGVGMSGIGQYHGQYSFESFSHPKSLYTKKWSFDFKLEYPPFTDNKLRWLRRLFKL